MYDIKLKQMEYFLDVAETLNLTYSAKRMYISQPLASNWIRSMEEELGVDLFRREKNGLVLTEEGKLLKEKWGPIMKAVRASIEEVHELNQKERILRIGCLEMYQHMESMHNMIASFREAYPGIKVELESFGARELADRLMAEDLDVILFTTLDIKENADFTWIPIQKMKFCIAISKNHPLAKKDVVRLSDLEHQILYGLNTIESPTSMKRVLKICRKAGFEPKDIKGVVNTASLTMNLIHQNGVAIVPEEFVAGHLDQLRTYDSDELDVDEYAAVVIRAKEPGEAARLFAQMAKCTV